MYLCEEYLQRNKTKINTVRHSTCNGYLFLNHQYKKYRSNWLVLSITWIKNESHPGTYRFSESVPRTRDVDGYLNTVSVWRGEWDQYEQYCLDFAKNYAGQAIVDETEKLVTAWEIFLRCFDDWFSQNVSPNSIYATVDLDRSLEERKTAIHSLLSHLAIDHKTAYNFWKNDIGRYFNNYSNWLGELVNGNKICTGAGQKSVI